MIKQYILNKPMEMQKAISNIVVKIMTILNMENQKQMEKTYKKT